MIKIEAAMAISVFLGISLLLVFSIWIFYNYNESININELSKLQQCSFCTYIFFKSADSDLLKCPRCNSLIFVRKTDNKTA